MLSVGLTRLHTSRNKPRELFTIRLRLQGNNTTRATTLLVCETCVETHTLNKIKNACEKIRHVLNLDVSCTILHYEFH